MFRELVYVGLGGFAGSALRYVVGRLLSGGTGGSTGAGAGDSISGAFPWGTMTVNVAGCLLVGIVYALAERGSISSPELRLLLAAGFCGGFTTFSAFMGENLAMLRAGELLLFALYTAGSLLLGLVAVWFGWWIAK